MRKFISMCSLLFLVISAKAQYGNCRELYVQKQNWNKAQKRIAEDGYKKIVADQGLKNITYSFYYKGGDYYHSGFIMLKNLKNKNQFAFEVSGWGDKDIKKPEELEKLVMYKEILPDGKKELLVMSSKGMGASNTYGIYDGETGDAMYVFPSNVEGGCSGKAYYNYIEVPFYTNEKLEDEFFLKYLYNDRDDKGYDVSSTYLQTDGGGERYFYKWKEKDNAYGGGYYMIYREEWTSRYTEVLPLLKKHYKENEL